MEFSHSRNRSHSCRKQMPAKKVLEGHCCLEMCLQQALWPCALSPAASRLFHSPEKGETMSLESAYV